MRILVSLLLINFYNLWAEPVVPQVEDKTKSAMAQEHSEESMLLIWPEVTNPDGSDSKNIHVEVEVNDEEPEIEGNNKRAFTVRQETLEEGLEFLSKKGVLPSFIILDRDHDVFQQRVTFSLLGKENSNEVLATLGEAFGFEMTPSHDIFLLKPKENQKKLTRPITVRLENAPIEQALLSIAKAGGLNLSFAQGLPEEMISIVWQNVDAMQGLQSIVKAKGLRLDQVGNIYVVSHDGHNVKSKKTHKIIKKMIQKDLGKKHLGKPNEGLHRQEIIIKK